MSKFIAALMAATLAVPSIAAAGPYLGAGLGGTRTESTLADLGLVPGIQSDLTGPDGIGSDPDFSSSQVGWDFVAGWRFNEYLALEAGYINFEKSRELYTLPFSPTPDPITGTCEPTGCQSREWTAQFTMDGIQAFVIGFYPVNEQVDVFGKVGAIYWNADYDGFERSASIVSGLPLGPQNEPISSDDDGTDVAAGVGLNLKTDSPVSIRADFTYYDIDNTDVTWFLQLLAIYNF